MIQGRSIIGVITARGGSKLAPRKNIRMVGNKPLIAWSIEAARASSVIDRVILSSDDEEIISVARQCGCEVPFVRPAELATDDADSADVLRHAVRNVGCQYDYAVLLQPTSPLRLSSDIDGAVQRCIESGASTCVSLSPVTHSPYWMFQINDDGIIAPLFPQTTLPVSRKGLSGTYILNGAIYVVSCKHLLEGGALLGADTVGWIMPDNRGLDIDTELDLLVADALLKR